MCCHRLQDFQGAAPRRRAAPSAARGPRGERPAFGLQSSPDRRVRGLSPSCALWLSVLTEILLTNACTLMDRFNDTGYIGSLSFLRAITSVYDKLLAKNPNLVYGALACAADPLTYPPIWRIRPNQPSASFPAPPPSLPSQVCDPVLGDGGKLYVPADLVDAYRDEVRIASNLRCTGFVSSSACSTPISPSPAPPARKHLLDLSDGARSLSDACSNAFESAPGGAQSAAPDAQPIRGGAPHGDKDHFRGGSGARGRIA